MSAYRLKFIIGIFLLIGFIQFSTYAAISKEKAIELAQNEIFAMASFSDKDLWTVSCQISTAYPMYIDGINGISYYECKVITHEGNDAGYVLVNVNETDLPIVESAIEGKTLTEVYRNALGHDNFKVLRYDWQ